jgi:hypothetical protein
MSYFRCDAWASIATLDVHHARVFGRCEAPNGIVPFDRLIEQVRTRPPCNDTPRVFWIVDNCSAHRGSKAAQRLRDQYPRLTLVHAAVHDNWLKQVESTSPSCHARFYPRTTFRAWKRWQNACSIFRTTGNQRFGRLNGNSFAKILPNGSQNSKISRRQSQDIRDRINETMYEGPYHPTDIMIQLYRDTI